MYYLHVKKQHSHNKLKVIKIDAESTKNNIIFASLLSSNPY